MTYGPLHLIVLGFDKPTFEGSVIDELDSLRKEGIIRLIDATVIYRGPDGEVVSIQDSDLGLDERIAVAGVIGALIGLGAGGKEGAELGALARMEAVAQNEYGLSEEDIGAIAEDMPLDSAALILLFEHVWAVGLKQAVLDAGGVVVAQGMLTAEALVGLGMDMADE